MSTDLKADLLEALNIADRFDHALTTEKKEELRARLKSATITEPSKMPPPDPCVMEFDGLNTWRNTLREDRLAIEDDEGDLVSITRSQAAALIPALQAFVREGGE